jgi:hypothetical protein
MRAALVRKQGLEMCGDQPVRGQWVYRFVAEEPLVSELAQ